MENENQRPELGEARAASVKRLAERYGKIANNELSIDVAMLDAHNMGFDAARDAVPRWVEINSVEDLPKEDGQYLWQSKTGHCEVYNFNQWRRPINYWVENFAHYQKIVSPTVKEKGDEIVSCANCGKIKPSPPPGPPDRPGPWYCQKCRHLEPRRYP